MFAVTMAYSIGDTHDESKGHVLNITSMGGVQGSAKFPGLSAYSSSKGALVILAAQTLAEVQRQWSLV